jgi:hypothetical protein
MGAYRQAMSSAAWILAHGARRTDAVSATITFGTTATLLVAPHQRPSQVLEMGASGGTTAFTHAVKLADQLLDLRRRTTVRMLAVVSDGALADPGPAQRLISTLHRTGCAVLWLHPAGKRTHTFTDTTTITVTNPVDAIEHIAQAATTALHSA